jgi:hypothetical protein
MRRMEVPTNRVENGGGGDSGTIAKLSQGAAGRSVNEGDAAGTTSSSPIAGVWSAILLFRSR